MKTFPVLTLLAGVALHCTPAMAEITKCTVIDSVPRVITVQGVYCLKGHVTTAMTNGVAIDIQANNVTIDLNGWKLGDGAAGAGTLALGIRARDRRNVTIRNGSIRQFHRGIDIDGTSSSGHLLEDLRLDGNTGFGIRVDGDDLIIRNNHIANTSTRGMLLYSGTGMVVTGNIVSGVSGPTLAEGVFISGVDGINFSGNTIMNVDAPSSIGIHMESSRGLISNNVLVNAMPGGTAIYVAGDPVTGCFDNVFHGYSTNIDGCPTEAGNQTF